MKDIQAASESIEGLGQALFMGKELKVGQGQPESKQEVHWLKDEDSWQMIIGQEISPGLL